MIRMRWILPVCFALSLLLWGCEGEPEDSPAESEQSAPLRPLVYTENPELTPQAAAVREGRLMRHLLEGSRGEGEWGHLEGRTPESFPRTRDPEAFGEALFRALVDRDESRWDSLFVAAQDWASLVRVEPQKAREYVDEQQGKSLEAWRLFRPEPASEAREGGFGAILEYRGVELGEGRNVAGKKSGEDEFAVQFWNNRLLIGLAETDVTFEFVIPKLVRVGGSPAELRIASEIRPDRRLEVVRGSGIHLKPQLLRSREYPYPLEVGNFWRYRRSRGEPSAESADSLEAGLEIAALATESLLEVKSVQRYGTIREVVLQRSYNDPGLTKEEEAWVVTPRRIYICTRACRSHIEDIGWLLEYFSREAPIFEFPLRPGQSWGPGGTSAQKGGDVFQVRSSDAVSVPAGVFDSVVAIEGEGPLGAYDEHLRAPQTRIFSPGRGVIRRAISGEGKPVVEELAEYRIMP